MKNVTRQAAEDLWESLGGDLCICQRHDVPHWCEKCQQRIDLIDSALAEQRAAATSVPWTRFYTEARREMEFRYGVKGAPKDRYKEQFALGRTPEQAAKALYGDRQGRGGSW